MKAWRKHNQKIAEKFAGDKEEIHKQKLRTKTERRNHFSREPNKIPSILLCKLLKIKHPLFS